MMVGLQHEIAGQYNTNWSVFSAGAILAAVSRDGVTILGPMDDADRSVVRDRLYTVGELMRQGVLTPEPPPAMGIVDSALAGVR